MILSSFYNDTRLYITVCNKSSLQDIRLVIEQRLASNRWRAMTPYPKFPPHRDQPSDLPLTSMLLSTLVP